MNGQVVTTKLCTKCRNVKASSDFYGNPTTRDGLHGWCKACCRADTIRRRQGVRKHPLVPPLGYQRCSGCKSVKPLEEFFRNKARSSGRASYCKDCFHDAPATVRATRRYRASEKFKTQRREYGRVYARDYRKKPGVREKGLLRQLTYIAGRLGLITQEPCRICEATATEAHHRSYEPLEVSPTLRAAIAEVLRVEWLCFLHHRKYHQGAPELLAQEASPC